MPPPPPPPPPTASGAHAPSTLPSLASDLDIVIPTIRDLSFLEDWRDTLSPYHLIIIQDGDPAAPRVRVPPGFDADVYTRADVERVLGGKAACISYKDSACRCFGFLVSKKRYIFTLDDDCFVAADPQGRRVNAVAAHIRNLLTPATPHFFNTLYDPYAEGADFVRGYPFSLRSGTPTAVSHGLWLGVPDYDAPTALAKPNERNARYVDAVLTVPARVLYPMCGMNLAFDRAAIGPAMYFGLMGDGAPWGRYDDMWAGWCSKVICDHLNLGVKSGTPYIRHARASNAFANLKKEYNGIFWQESCVEFFRNVTLPDDATDALSCYVALAHLVKKHLASVDPYFTRLADAMLTWTQAWRELNPEWPYVGSAAQDAPAKLVDTTASASDTAVDAGATLTLGGGGDRAGDKPCDTPTSPPAQRAAKRGRTAVAS